MHCLERHCLCLDALNYALNFDNNLIHTNSCTDALAVACGTLAGCKYPESTDAIESRLLYTALPSVITLPDTGETITVSLSQTEAHHTTMPDAPHAR